MEKLARRIAFGGSLQLPPVRIRAQEVEDLKVNSILRLGISATSLAEWWISGERVSAGQPIRQGAYRAVRLVDRGEAA